MPLLRVNVIKDLPQAQHPGGLDVAVAENLAQIPAEAPVVVLVHGYTFSPSTPLRDPHRHILSLKPRRGCWKALSWPRHLGFGRGRADEGLCVAFGWEARGSIWRAWRSAGQAGQALAELITCIRHHRPGPVHIVAHSLGARVALAALPGLPAGSVGRAVLMAAAEYQGAAAATLSAPAGQTAEFINVTSRENDLFDAIIEWLIQPRNRGDRTLGAGLWTGASNWLDVQMDCRRTRAALEALGYRIPPPVVAVCHWWAYLRPGLMPLYQDLIRRPEALPLAMLRHALPRRPGRRWSRLWGALGATLRRAPARRVA